MEPSKGSDARGVNGGSVDIESASSLQAAAAEIDRQAAEPTGCTLCHLPPPLLPPAAGNHLLLVLQLL
jgi:hypothetical protein